MQETLNQMHQAAAGIQPAGSYFILFLAAAALLLAAGRERERFLGAYGLACAFFVCNPLFAWAAARLFPETASYVPLLAGLPAAAVMAAAAANVVENGKSRLQRFALAAALALLLGAAGSGYGLESGRLGGFSLETVPAEEKQVLDLLQSQGEPALLLAADPVAEQAREYAPGIRLLYGKDMWTSGLNLGIMDVYGEDLQSLHESMQNPAVCMEDIVAVAAIYECDAVVTARFEGAGEREGGYRLSAESEHYLIYRKEVTE